MALLSGQREARIGRSVSPTQFLLFPILSVMAGSLAPLLPVIATQPLMPPLGFLMLIGWRLLRREIWAPWAAAPLGLFDDLFSGQPMGSAILLWSLCLLAIEALDRRMVWRSFWQDWVIASALVIAVLLAQLSIANGLGGALPANWLLPQIILSILCFPLIVRLCARIDRVRSRL